MAGVDTPGSIDEMIAIVKNAAAKNIPLRASGHGHMWYDTQCADDSRTRIVRTENLNRIYDFDLQESSGSVMIEAGVTFFQLAQYLHERGASIGYTLVNWNMTVRYGS